MAFDYHTDIGYIYYNVGGDNQRIENPDLSSWEDVDLYIPSMIRSIYYESRYPCSVKDKLSYRYLKIRTEDQNQYLIAVPFNSSSPLWSAMITEVLSDTRIIEREIIPEKISPSTLRLLAFR